MTPTTSFISAPAAGRPVAVTVACIGLEHLYTETLGATLSRVRTRRPAGWEAPSGYLPPGGRLVDVVLCDAAYSGVATRRRPGSAIIAILPDHDDGTAAVAALDAGATACVRGEDVAAAAAVIADVESRRGLLVEDLTR